MLSRIFFVFYDDWAGVVMRLVTKKLQQMTIVHIPCLISWRKTQKGFLEFTYVWDLAMFLDKS